MARELPRSFPPAVRTSIRELAEPYDLAPARALVAKHERLGYPFACEFGGVRLRLTEGVFCPTLTNVSPLLLDAVDFRPGERVLEAFAGSGALGILAATHGAGEAVLVDISAPAIACAEGNARLNGVADRVHGRIGTVAETVEPGETFDLVIANPPLLPISAEVGALTAALFDPGLVATNAFVDLLPRLLKPAGRCYLVSSSAAEKAGHDLEKRFAANNLVASLAAKADFAHESYRVHKLTRA